MCSSAFFSETHFRVAKASNEHTAVFSPFTVGKMAWHGACRSAKHSTQSVWVPRASPTCLPHRSFLSYWLWPCSSWVFISPNLPGPAFWTVLPRRAPSLIVSFLVQLSSRWAQTYSQAPTNTLENGGHHLILVNAKTGGCSLLSHLMTGSGMRGSCPVPTLSGFC